MAAGLRRLREGSDPRAGRQRDPAPARCVLESMRGSTVMVIRDRIPISSTIGLPAAATLSAYVGALRADGVTVVTGSAGTYWVASGGVARRLPMFHVGTPEREEVDRVLRTTGA